MQQKQLCCRTKYSDNGAHIKLQKLFAAATICPSVMKKKDMKKLHLIFV